MKHTFSPTRRQALQIGGFGGLTSLLGDHSAAPAVGSAVEGKSPKSVLFIFLAGGPSHLDTFDMKPDAPAEIRGEFAPIATKTPGLQVCEHLPLLAQRTDKFTLVRTLALKSGSDAVHELAAPLILSGTDLHPAGSGTVWSRHDWPCYGGALEYVRPREDGLPSGVSLPYVIGPFPGQDAGFLGPLYDPWRMNIDLNNPAFDPESMRLPDGFSLSRLSRRNELLTALSKAGGGHPKERQFRKHQERAFKLLARGSMATAFDLKAEPRKILERYGDHLWSKSLVFGRRLIEAGVPIVQVNLGHPYFWDTHIDNFKGHKETLLPPFDRAFSALLDDMEASGLLEETLVVAVGEFGRTPKIGGNVGTPMFSPTGRDHWVHCFCGLFAGAGVQPGQVIGRTDSTASYPVTNPYFPSDLGATIFSTLGVDLHSEIRDRFGRPYRVNEGQVMQTLYDASRTS
ncbi:MAG: DUF1501 domain-containing protein [Pirellulaceae bacterium]|nr:DUF1501 domain-containing protein [Pirellulaceae bacterium]